jgi:hypothetical protein
MKSLALWLHNKTKPGIQCVGHNWASIPHNRSIMASQSYFGLYFSFQILSKFVSIASKRPCTSPRSHAMACSSCSCQPDHTTAAVLTAPTCKSATAATHSQRCLHFKAGTKPDCSRFRRACSGPVSPFPQSMRIVIRRVGRENHSPRIADALVAFLLRQPKILRRFVLSKPSR